MADKLPPEMPPQNDSLIEFTDQLLDGQGGETKVTQDQDELGLQTTVVRLHNALGPSAPDSAMAKRIQARLVAEWRRLQSTPRSWRQISADWLAAFRRSPARAWAVALSVVAVLLLVTPFVLQNENLVGASGGTMGLMPFIIIGVVILLGGVLMWFSRRK